jgi:hypothetical protein
MPCPSVNGDNCNTAGGTPLRRRCREFNRKSRSAAAAGRRYIWRSE